MIIYEISQQLTPVAAAGAKPIVAVATTADLAQPLPADFTAAMILPWQNSRFSKAELQVDHVRGTFYAPKHRGNKEKKDKRDAEVLDETTPLPPPPAAPPPLRCAFVITAKGALFVDDKNTVENYLQKIVATRVNSEGSVLLFFGELLAVLIENDLLYLAEMQMKLLKLEKNILDNTLGNFTRTLMSLRKDILTLTRYYSQLIDMAQVLLEYGANATGKTGKQENSQLRTFIARAGRLRDEAQSLREYLTHLRDVYHTQINFQQNQVMKLLAVISTIFMPLTFVVGWYGMNFKVMPELDWTYGYPFVGAVCLLIVGACLWIFTKKNYW
ncbi:hypothetical protein FACS1894139_18630 [Planctomycetales bacterium]|nr:hypothetical protein FACS1894107_16180 [Planctomycetales bacterium]GHT01351.1 hypothetical protein FACS1894108_14980 [Planctomycetales bacterium]GHT08679.1 hypothetical protein FACS1894139_18630 [Planctomycetales bacterium]